LNPAADTQKASAQAILDVARIVDVRPTRINAEAVKSVGHAIETLNFETKSEFIASRGCFANRFTYKIQLSDVQGEVVGQMEFELHVEWELPRDFTPDPAGADFVTGTTGYFAAFPYARELLQTTTARLGFDPVVLGLLNRDTLEPRGISVAVRGRLPELEAKQEPPDAEN
jgi:hypothetical protein